MTVPQRVDVTAGRCRLSIVVNVRPPAWTGQIVGSNVIDIDFDTLCTIVNACQQVFVVFRRQ
jgi:hypothetical protein